VRIGTRGCPVFAIVSAFSKLDMSNLHKVQTEFTALQEFVTKGSCSMRSWTVYFIDNVQLSSTFVFNVNACLQQSHLGGSILFSMSSVCVNPGFCSTGGRILVPCNFDTLSGDPVSALSAEALPS
jgi:hypothetical protein